MAGPAAAPAVSIIVPVYNKEAYVRETIESVLAQTYRDFELIIVENASTDGSRAVVESFSDPRIRLILRPKTLPVDENWNEALTQVRGSCVKLVCSDDVIHPTCLEEQVRVLGAPGHEGVVMVGCAKQLLSHDSKLLGVRGVVRREGRRDGRAAVRQAVRCGANPIGEPAGVLLRTAALRQAGGFSLRLPYVLDLECWSRVLRHGDLYMLRQPLYGFRLSRSMTTGQIGLAQYRQFLDFARLMRRAGLYDIGAMDLLVARVTAFVQSALRFLYMKLKVTG